jgi:hypothetical protein
MQPTNHNKSPHTTADNTATRAAPALHTATKAATRGQEPCKREAVGRETRGAAQ